MTGIICLELRTRDPEIGIVGMELTVLVRSNRDPTRQSHQILRKRTPVEPEVKRTALSEESDARFC
jgi:hypothetical protein